MQYSRTSQNESPSTHKEYQNPSPLDHPLPPSYPIQMTNVNSLNSIKAPEFSNLVDLNLLNIILSQKLHPPTISHPTLAQVEAHGGYCACYIYNHNHFQKIKNDLDYIISILLSPGFLPSSTKTSSPPYIHKS